MNKKTITIATLVRNREYILPHYLNHIYNIDYDKSKINILWVVNNSNDNSQKILEDFKSKYNSEYNKIKIDVINKTNLKEDTRKKEPRIDYIYKHLAELRNYICENSNTDYLFSIDSDILVLDKDILNKFTSYDKDIVSSYIYNGYIFAKDTNYKHSPYDFTNAMIFNNRFDKYKRPIFEIFSRSHIKKIGSRLQKIDITGAVYLIKKQVYKNKNVKYDFYHQGEDIPFCVSAIRSGYKVYCDFGTYSQHIMSEEFLEKYLNGEKLY